MKLISILSAITIIYSCSQPTVNTKTEGEKLMQTSRDWSKSAAIPDSIEKTLSYWANDAMVIAAGQPIVKGKDAIRQMVEESYKMPGFKISWEPQSAQISKDGDMGYMIEENQITVNDSTGKPVTQRNMSVTIWRKEKDGSWKNVVDFSTPSQVNSNKLNQ